MRVCWLWYDLARDMPTRCATATIAGHLGTPLGEFDDDEKNEIEATFAVLTLGGLAVADACGSRIQFYSAGLTPFRSIGQEANLSRPQGLATDGTHLFVADSLTRQIKQIRLNDAVVVDSVLEGLSGHSWPAGLALVRGSKQGGNDDRLYVADCGNHRLCTFGVSPLRFITSIGQRGSAPLEFSSPYGIAVDAGNLFVSDSGNRRVQVLTLGLELLRCFDVGYSPACIAVRPDGRLLVMSGNGGRVEMTTRFGSLLQVRLPHVYAVQCTCLHMSSLSTPL